MDEETSTTTSSTESIIYTPTQSNDSGVEANLLRLSLNRNLNERATTSPWRGKTYAIFERASNRVMALRSGEIVLIDTQGLINHFLDASCHWHCSENTLSGWWGFCNAASGMFIGEEANRSYDYYDSRRKSAKLQMLTASSKGHSESHWIYIKQHPEGGHELLVNRCGRLAAVTLEEKDTSNQKLVVGGNGTPIRWNFIEV